MLAELAAANAAFAIIKSAVMNGKSIATAGKSINDFVFAKEELGRQTRKKKRRGYNEASLEEFLALQQIKKKEDELRSMMQLYGPPGMFQEWQKFQAEARKSRQLQKRLAEKRREEIIEIIGWGFGATIIASFIGVLVYFALVARGIIK